MRPGMKESVLVGRTAERELMRAAREASLSGQNSGGQTRTVVIGGEAGIGKTRLPAAFSATSSGDDTAYEFRHALVRDAIHGERV